MSSFKERWQIKSNWQVFVIIVVFAITGSSSAYLSKPLCSFLNINKESFPIFIYYLLRILIIFPIYQVLLVSIGSMFGQFRFFWNFEKKMLRSMGLGFLFKE